MTIAEKLTTIAENEQRVYEAGQQAERNKLEGEIEALETEIATLTEQKASLELEVERLNGRVISLNNDLDYLNELIVAYQGEIDRLNIQIAEKQSQIDALNARISELEAEVNSQIELRLEAEAQLPIKYQEGHADGVAAENTRIWNGMQSNGSRTEYPYAYAYNCWTDELFTPPFAFTVTNGDSMFRRTGIVHGLKDKSFDFSQCTNANYMFWDSKTVEMPEFNFGEKVTDLIQTFAYCAGQPTIVLHCHENMGFNGTFLYSKLRGLTVIGTIGKNGFDVQWAMLSHDDLMTIMYALADKTGDTSTTWKVILGSTNKAKLTDAELQIAYSKNWAVA